MAFQVIGEAAFSREAQRLERKLATFGKTTFKKRMRQAMNAAAKPIQKAAKRNAPKLTGALRKSISVKAKRRRGKMSWYAIIGPRVDFVAFMKDGGKLGTARGKNADAVKRGRINPSKYAHLVELGTSHSAAKPFMRTAFDSQRRAAEAAMVAHMRKSLRIEARKR